MPTAGITHRKEKTGKRPISTKKLTAMLKSRPAKRAKSTLHPTAFLIRLNAPENVKFKMPKIHGGNAPVP